MPCIVNFAKELAKSRGRYTMECQSSLTLCMHPLDNAPRTPSGVVTAQSGATMRRNVAVRRRCTGRGQQHGWHAHSRHGRGGPGGLSRDADKPTWSRSSSPGRLGCVAEVDKKTEKFSKKLLSSAFKPCSIVLLSRAKLSLNMVNLAARWSRSATVPTPRARCVFLSCGRPATPVATRGCLSSSSLPPSFARGRRTTVFYSEGFGHVGADLRGPAGVMT